MNDIKELSFAEIEYILEGFLKNNQQGENGGILKGSDAIKYLKESKGGL